MARRIRKQVYLELRHEQMLKRRASERGVTEAEIIRNALDQWHELGVERRQPLADPVAGRKLLASLRSLSAKGARARPRRRWSRESLYGERTGRWTRS